MYRNKPKIWSIRLCSITSPSLFVVRTKILLQNIQCLSNLIATLWQSLSNTLALWWVFHRDAALIFSSMCFLPVHHHIPLTESCVFYPSSSKLLCTLSGHHFRVPVGRREREETPITRETVVPSPREKDPSESSALCEQNSRSLVKARAISPLFPSQRSWASFSKLPTTSVNHLTLC